MDPATTNRRAEANRRNAQKSTGPKTAEGKARSRRNALRHGLAAEVLVPEADRGAVAAAVAEWNHEVWPENVAERAVIRRMAVADVRLQRCEQATEQNLESTARSAVDRWRLRKQNAARKRACALKTDPLNTLLDLEDSAFGCEWLIRRWSALDRVLEQGLGWSDDDRETSMRLIGYVPVAPGPDGAPEARQMWRLGRLASGLEVEPLEDGEPNDPAAARLALRALIADRLTSSNNEPSPPGTPSKGRNAPRSSLAVSLATMAPRPSFATATTVTPRTPCSAPSPCSSASGSGATSWPSTTASRPATTRSSGSTSAAAGGARKTPTPPLLATNPSIASPHHRTHPPLPTRHPPIPTPSRSHGTNPLRSHPPQSKFRRTTTRKTSYAQTPLNRLRVVPSAPAPTFDP